MVLSVYICCQANISLSSHKQQVVISVFCGGRHYLNFTVNTSFMKVRREFVAFCLMFTCLLSRFYSTCLDRLTLIVFYFFLPFFPDPTVLVQRDGKWSNYCDICSLRFDFCQPSTTRAKDCLIIYHLLFITLIL